ncbi:MAG TPA: ATP-binding protein [Elusimicrobiales bacterium]|nr:ATP-binding protein [Elusimicrobiales bacterium]
MPEDIKPYIIDFLKSFTRIIVQGSLYASDHPQVKSASAETVERLKKLIEKIGTEKVSFTLSNGKFLLNGTQVSTQDRLPSSIISIYKNCHIDTIEMSKDATAAEFVSFSKIAASKTDPLDYLKRNDIKNITLQKEKYVKAGEGLEGLGKAVRIDGEIENKDFVGSLKAIVSRLTEDNLIQEKIVNNLMEKFKIEVQNAVEKAVKEIKTEKTKIENDYIRTESVISNIAGSEITIDKDGNVIMASADAEKITGKSLKEIAGRKIFDIANLEEQILNIAQEIKTVSNGKIIKDVSAKGKADIIKTIKNSTAMIKNEDGKIVGTISIPPDVAKLKEVEQLKSDFISNVTHELRSPLTSIKMALDLISRENISNPNTRMMLNSAIRNAERLNSIINDILDFSKMQSGKMIFHLDRYSPNEIAQNAVDAMAAWAKSKNLNLILNKKENLPDIYADKKRTEQILINLISNAIKFTPEGGSIEVSVGYETSNPDFIQFYVKDTGCGIKKEDQEKIFEKFVQVVAGEKVGGTGLGLAITKAMVVMQSGSISVDSEVGKGSIFKVLMPVYKGQELNTHVSISEESTENKKDFRPWWKRLFGI